MIPAKDLIMILVSGYFHPTGEEKILLMVVFLTMNLDMVILHQQLRPSMIVNGLCMAKIM